MEEVLRSGGWLVTLAAVWSGPDRMAIPIAYVVARRLEGRVRVAIRPFDAHAEMQNWLPELQVEYVSPIWVLLRDGELVDFKTGIRPRDKLVDWVKSHIAQG